MVEDVAETVEKIADDIGNNFPDGGKLRSLFDLVENAAKETAKDAHIVDQFIEKVCILFYFVFGLITYIINRIFYYITY